MRCWPRSQLQSKHRVEADPTRSLSTQSGGAGKCSGRTERECVGAVMAVRTDITRRVRNWGGRVACEPTKTATTADGLGLEAVVTPGVSSNGMSGRKCGGTDEILCGRCGRHRKGTYTAERE